MNEALSVTASATSAPLRALEQPKRKSELAHVVWSDRIIGGLIIVACIPLWFAADKFPQLGGAFPKTVVVAIALLSAVMIVQSLVGSRIPRGDGRMESGALVLPLVVGTASIVAVLAMRFVGYFPAMIALSSALFFVLAGERRVLYAVSVAISLAFVFVVFVVLLGVSL